MEVLEVEGLVIKKVDYGEADRIITVFEPGRGKIIASVRGIRKSRNRETYATEPLVIGRYKINKKPNSAIVTGLSVENPFVKIKTDYFKLQIAIYILKVIDTITFEDIPSDKLYKLVKNSLEYLEDSEDEKIMLNMLNYFLYKIIRFEGLAFEIEGEKYFNFDLGKIGDKNTLDSIKLEKFQYEYLKLLNNVDIERLNKLKSKNKNILTVGRILERYINYNLHLELKIYTYLGEEFL